MPAYGRCAEQARKEEKPPSACFSPRAEGSARRVVPRLMAGFAFLRTLVQTRSRGHSAVGAVAYRFGLAAESSFAGDDGQPRAFDYSARRGIAAKGAALPDGAAAAWRNPLEWARRVEAADRRRNSRQCRDDVLALPTELVESGKAQAAVGAYAQRLAERWRTPVHWVLHDQDSGNPHAHLLYAGRQITKDGDAFAARRDRAQDATPDPDTGRVSLPELHKKTWTEVLADHGVVVQFGPDGEIAQAHIGPRAWAIERAAIRDEVAERIAAALDPDDPFDPGDLAQVADLAIAGLTVTEALEMDRVAVTPQMQACPRPLPVVEDPEPLPTVSAPPPALSWPSPPAVKTSLPLPWPVPTMSAPPPALSWPSPPAVKTPAPLPWPVPTMSAPPPALSWPSPPAGKTSLPLPWPVPTMSAPPPALPWPSPPAVKTPAPLGLPVPTMSTPPPALPWPSPPAVKTPAPLGVPVPTMSAPPPVLPWSSPPAVKTPAPLPWPPVPNIAPPPPLPRPEWWPARLPASARAVIAAAGERLQEQLDHLVNWYQDRLARQKAEAAAKRERAQLPHDPPESSGGGAPTS